jgi:hypothetical protein
MHYFIAMNPETHHDPIIALYKRDVDRTLLRQNLRLSAAQRLEKMLSALRMTAQLRGVARPKSSQPSK